MLNETPGAMLRWKNKYNKQPISFQFLLDLTTNGFDLVDATPDNLHYAIPVEDGSWMIIIHADGIIRHIECQR